MVGRGVCDLCRFDRLELRGILSNKLAARIHKNSRLVTCDLLYALSFAVVIVFSGGPICRRIVDLDLLVVTVEYKLSRM